MPKFNLEAGMKVRLDPKSHIEIPGVLEIVYVNKQNTQAIAYVAKRDALLEFHWSDEWGCWIYDSGCDSYSSVPYYGFITADSIIR
jgi:hypothetical protein